MIVPMKRLTLVALKADEERILQALQAICAVQVIKAGDTAVNESALEKAEGDVQRFHSALTLLRPYAQKPSVLNPKPEMTIEALRENVEVAQTISGEIEAADRKKAALRAQIDKNNTQIEMLTPWIGIGVRLDEIRPTKSTALFAGKLKVEELSRLAELDGLCAVEAYGGEKERAVLIICPLSMQDEINTLVKGMTWTDMNFPKLDKTPDQAVANYQEEIKALQAQQEALELEMKKLGANRAIIANAQDAAVIERDRTLAHCALDKTGRAFVLEGWVRSDETVKVEHAVNGVTDAYFIEYREPEEDELPPAVVKNSRFAKPFESITNLYSRPLPGTIDGTPFMAPWYVLLFGMMLSDTGYGLLLALGCTLFIKRAKPVGMMGDIVRVLKLGGISTIFWGVLIGTFFGFDWNAIFGTVGVFPLIVDPGSDPITMLALCFGLGLVHIFCGVFIKIYMAFRDGDWQTAVYDNISWVLMVFGLLMYALIPALGTVGIVMALIGAAMVLFMKGRGKRNIAKRLVSGAGGLYDITAYLSDMLSYARLFALGIATGVIGSVFNQLVGMLMSASDFILLRIVLVVVGVALFVFMHIFNLFINTLGTFVHCARLQFVEFYGKFYEVGGKEFRPLGYKTRNSRVTQP